MPKHSRHGLAFAVSGVVFKVDAPVVQAAGVTQCETFDSQVQLRAKSPGLLWSFVKR